MSESVILCEGYHDRAFWAGWLTHLGCSDEGFRPGTKGYPGADPWGVKIGGGKFAYRSPSGAFVRVVPCGGRSNILRAARLRLTERPSKALARLVINVDPDTPVGSAASVPPGLTIRDVLSVGQTFDPTAALNVNNEIELDGGASKISLIRWETSDPPADGVPNQQTLERLICAALVAAYPVRANSVKIWLDSRPAAPLAGPKEHAWSYMARWYADNGCDDFFGHMWREPMIVRELELRLRASHGWPIVAAIAT